MPALILLFRIRQYHEHGKKIEVVVNLCLSYTEGKESTYSGGVFALISKAVCAF